MLMPSFLRSFINRNHIYRARPRVNRLPSDVPVLEARLLLTDNSLLIGVSFVPPEQIFNTTPTDSATVIATPIPWTVSGAAAHPSTLTITSSNGLQTIYTNISGSFNIPFITQTDTSASQTLNATLTDPILGTTTALPKTEAELTFTTNLSDAIKSFAQPQIPGYIQTTVNTVVPAAFNPLRGLIPQYAIQQNAQDNSMSIAGYTALDNSRLNDFQDSVKSLAASAFTDGFGYTTNGTANPGQTIKIKYVNDNPTVAHGVTSFQSYIDALTSATPNFSSGLSIPSLTLNDPNVVNMFHGSPSGLFYEVAAGIKVNVGVSATLPRTSPYFQNRISANVTGIGYNQSNLGANASFNIFNNDPGYGSFWDITLQYNWTNDPNSNHGLWGANGLKVGLDFKF